MKNLKLYFVIYFFVFFFCDIFKWVTSVAGYIVSRSKQQWEGTLPWQAANPEGKNSRGKIFLFFIKNRNQPLSFSGQPRPRKSLMTRWQWFWRPRLTYQMMMWRISTRNLCPFTRMERYLWKSSQKCLEIKWCSAPSQYSGTLTRLSTNGIELVTIVISTSTENYSWLHSLEIVFAVKVERISHAI